MSGTKSWVSGAATAAVWLVACGPKGVAVDTDGATTSDTGSVHHDTASADTSVTDTAPPDTSIPDTGHADTSTVDTSTNGSTAPVAVCAVDEPESTVPEDRPIHFLGGASYDPQGQPIVSWAWTFDVPAGSNAEVEGTPSKPDRSVYLDAPGIYTGTLVVTTADGRTSAPCATTSTATPWFAVDVSLTWTQEGDDLDLHLLAPDGVLEADSDCFYADCLGRGPNWGDAGTRDDDPQMVTDDTRGTGPEQSGIHAPAPGRYTVVVHDFPTPDVIGDDMAFVNITFAGSTHTFARAIAEEDRYYTIATIDLPDGTINECPDDGC